jgi:hypothetical protein
MFYMQKFYLTKFTKHIIILADKSLGHYELKQHKLWYHEEFSKWLDTKKQAKLQW